MWHLLHLLCLLLLCCFLFSHLLHLRFLILLTFLLFFLLLFIFRHFFLCRLLYPQTNWEPNELRVFAHQISNCTLLQHIFHITLDVKNDLRSTTQRLLSRRTNREWTTCRRLPHILLIVIVLRNHFHTISNQIGRIETHTKLTNHTHITRSSLKRLHKGLSTWTSNSTQIVNKISLCHSNTRITNGQSLVGLISNDLNHQIRIWLQLGGISQGFITNLIQSIRCIGDQLTKENVLVLVEGVNDQRHKLSNISAESKGFRLFSHVLYDFTKWIRKYWWFSLIAKWNLLEPSLVLKLDERRVC